MRCAVLGSPVAHSLSPVMHRAAYARLGLDDWSYTAHDVDEDSLRDFVAGLDDTWRGLSLTRPLKRAILPLLDGVSGVAVEVSAVNTVLLDSGRLVGDNTDVPGAAAALAERGVTRVLTACILGAGATAASTAAALRPLGLSRLLLAARDAARAEAVAGLVRSWGVEVRVVPLDDGVIAAVTAAGVDVTISTVPAVVAAGVAAGVTQVSGAVFDVVYDPWPTPLASATEQAGVPVVSGLDLLAHQAALQVQLMTGRDVPAALLRAAAERQLRG